MARRRRNRRPIEKAIPAQLGSATSGQVYTAEQVAGLLAQQARQGDTASLARPLPRDTYPYAFGPGIPLTPAPLDPTRASGRAEPRLWEYPVSWNMPGQSSRLVPWKTLRDAANLPLIRDCLRVRKEEVRGLEWDFVLSRRAVDKARREKPDAGALDVERELRDRFVGDIDAAIEFWQVPDRGNGYTFTEWLCAALEEMLVLDALPIYPRYTLGGDLYSLEVLDGSTIKPLLNHRGGRPAPPEPAYQQIIHGFPRGEFMADVSDMDGAEQIPGAYTSDQLIYIRREVRTHTPYGLSPVEQALMDIDLWMKRVAWVRAEYTDGVMPSGWIINEQTGSTMWTPAQVAEYETALNDHLSGNTAARHRYRVLPPGLRPDDSASADRQSEKYKPEFDLFLIKLVAGHFDLTAHELGFVEAQGLGGEGHAEGQDRLGERKGRKPALRWIANLITDISRAHLGLPRELEFQWLGIEDESDSDQDEDRTVEDVAAGLMTLNEGRDRRGLPRYSIPEADKPAIISSSGTITFVEGAEERAEAAAELEERAVDAKERDPGAGSTGSQAGGSRAGQPSASSRSDSNAGGSSAKHAEAAAYRRWAAKGRTGRRFQLQHIVEPADLLKFDIDPALVTFGGDLGKADAPDPGADLDRIAADTADRLRDAAVAAVDVDALLAAWNGRNATKGALGSAARWVRDKAQRLIEAIGQVIREALEEGWTAGTQTAVEQLQEQLEQVEADSGAGERLRALLDAAEVVIRSVADSRFNEMAEVLEQHRDDPGRAARELRAVLQAPQWAETVAITETARAMSAATQATYQANRVQRKSWLLAPDQRVCPTCSANAAQGAIDTTDRFASGDMYPPAHPNCRCALMPVIVLPTRKAADRYQLRDYWLHGEGAARWKTWTDLYNHLKDHVGDERAKRMAAQWYHDRYGRWPGEKGHDD
jgi:SPP1 gp7 family putative phage head morphogenesis protein